MVFVTRLRAGRSGVRILVEARDFSLLRNVPIGSGDRPASYSMGIGVLFRRVKRPGRGVNHSPASEWSHTSTIYAFKAWKGKILLVFFFNNSCLLICFLDLILFCHTYCVTALLGVSVHCQPVRAKQDMYKRSMFFILHLTMRLVFWTAWHRIQ